MLLQSQEKKTRLLYSNHWFPGKSVFNRSENEIVNSMPFRPMGATNTETDERAEPD